MTKHFNEHDEWRIETEVKLRLTDEKFRVIDDRFKRLEDKLNLIIGIGLSSVGLPILLHWAKLI